LSLDALESLDVSERTINLSNFGCGTATIHHHPPPSTAHRDFDHRIIGFIALAVWQTSSAPGSVHDSSADAGLVD